MTTIARAYRYMPEHMKLQAKREAKIIVGEMFRQAQPDWSLPEPVTPTSGAHAKRLRKRVEEAEEEGSNSPIVPKKPSQGDVNKLKEKERKARKKKRKLGLKAGKDADLETKDGFDSDPDSIEEDNQDRKKKKDRSKLPDFETQNSMGDAADENNAPSPREKPSANDGFDDEDIDIVSDFEKEIEELRDALSDDFDPDDDKPRPEKW